MTKPLHANPCSASSSFDGRTSPEEFSALPFGADFASVGHAPHFRSTANGKWQMGSKTTNGRIQLLAKTIDDETAHC
jgi:hypothetical protein